MDTIKKIAKHYNLHPHNFRSWFERLLKSRILWKHWKLSCLIMRMRMMRNAEKLFHYFFKMLWIAFKDLELILFDIQLAIKLFSTLITAQITTQPQSSSQTITDIFSLNICKILKIKKKKRKKHTFKFFTVIFFIFFIVCFVEFMFK